MHLVRRENYFPKVLCHVRHFQNFDIFSLSFARAVELTLSKYVNIMRISEEMLFWKCCFHKNRQVFKNKC